MLGLGRKEGFPSLPWLRRSMGSPTGGADLLICSLRFPLPI